MKQITIKCIKRAPHHKNANKTTALLLIRRITVILFVVIPWPSIIYYSGSNISK